jgi:5-methylcytosine-specific restriction protein A
MKNPDWNREELIMALDLYFNLEYGQMDGRNPEVIALGHLLTLMTGSGDYRRSENSVSLKLANFKRLDPEFNGKGMKGGNKLEEEVWNEFHQERAKLKAACLAIKTRVLGQLAERIAEADTELQMSAETEARTEGGMKVYISRRAERDIALKTRAIAIHGTACKACGFDFGQTYGEWGLGFIEVHHLIPLGGKNTGTRLTDPEKDMIVICSNCHRMVHRRKEMVLTLDELKQKLTSLQQK